MTGGQPVLYLIACAAPPARDAATLVKLAQTDGWDVCVVATPSAARFVDTPALEALSGHPVRAHYKVPGEPDVLDPPDAIVVAPATFNTVNKWALGISDNLALGLLTEGMGRPLPIVAVPFVNRAQAAHPAFGRSVGLLRATGVRVLAGPEVLALHEPGDGEERAGLFPWAAALHALDELR